MSKKIRNIQNQTSFPLTSSLENIESRVRNDRQSIFSIVRELVHAQFELGDTELTNRLWQDVADREIDIQRIINLMYGCIFYDDEEMLAADLAYEKLH